MKFIKTVSNGEGKIPSNYAFNLSAFLPIIYRFEKVNSVNKVSVKNYVFFYILKSYFLISCFIKTFKFFTKPPSFDRLFSNFLWPRKNNQITL